MAARTVTVRGVQLGEGRPEIIVPLTGADDAAVMAQVDAALPTGARILEWRTDLFAEHLDTSEHRAAVLELLPRIREALGEQRALLVTLRTAAEGGKRSLADSDLGELLEAVMRTGAADLVDVETARDAAIVQRVVQAAGECGVLVVGSFHDFAGTPEEDRLVEVLRSQRRAGVDVPKIAVMPREPGDVLRLLQASLRVAADGSGPHIAISMGSLGTVSRVAAEVFGSAATFATAGSSAAAGSSNEERGSAPGQLAVRDVQRMLELLRP